MFKSNRWMVAVCESHFALGLDSSLPGQCNEKIATQAAIVKLQLIRKARRADK
jgi:hypothetical protein